MSGENELALYGFLTEEERALFELLMDVSGVGPKVALSVLSTLSPDAIRQAVVREEPGILTRVPGVGAKTARAIIFHLKDKLGAPEAGAVPLLTDQDAEVIATLTSLGFSLVEAQTALQHIPTRPEPPAGGAHPAGAGLPGAWIEDTDGPGLRSKVRSGSTPWSGSSWPSCWSSPAA